MKAKYLFLCLLFFHGATGISTGAEGELAETFRDAMFQEEGNRDLDAAIATWTDASEGLASDSALRGIVLSRIASGQEQGGHFEAAAKTHEESRLSEKSRGSGELGFPRPPRARIATLGRG